MFGCKCCRCSTDSLDFSKSHSEVINTREKVTEAEAKSYKKLRLSSFIPESYFVNGQTVNCASTSQTDCLMDGQDKQTKVKIISQLNASNETKPKLPFQPPIFEDEVVNEAETLIGPNSKIVNEIDRVGRKSKKLGKIEQLQIANETTYNFDYNLYSIKKNISVWCIDIALLTSNGQTLRQLMNTNNDPTGASDELMTTMSSIPSNATGLVEDEERKKFNELWGFYLFMFNFGLVCSSILLQLLVGILLLMNTKSSKKHGPSFPRRSGECYNHLILLIILFITVINVFIVIFVDEGT